MTTTINDFIGFLKENDNFLIFTHSLPDADTLGSAFSVCRFLRDNGKKAAVFNANGVSERLDFLKIGGMDVITEIPEGNFTRLSIDIASYPMLKGLDEDYINNLVFDFSVDHHKGNKLKAEKLLCFSSYPATGEIIAQALERAGVVYDKTYATWLYAAISADSGCFRYSSTKPQTLRIASELIKTGIDFAYINRRIFENVTPIGIELEKAAYNGLKFYHGGKVAVVCLPEELVASADYNETDLDGVYQIPRKIKGVEVSAVFVPKGDEIKASFRSNDYYDVEALAAKFGGGGHTHAAGCRFYNGMENAVESVVSALSEDFG